MTGRAGNRGRISGNGELSVIPGSCGEAQIDSRLRLHFTGSAHVWACMGSMYKIQAKSEYTTLVNLGSPATLVRFFAKQ